MWLRVILPPIPIPINKPLAFESASTYSRAYKALCDHARALLLSRQKSEMKNDDGARRTNRTAAYKRERERQKLHRRLRL